MADFECGVKEYITGNAIVTVNFPVDFNGKADISCYQCPYFNRTSCTCQITKSVVNYPQKYVGNDCPLEMEKSNEF